MLDREKDRQTKDQAGDGTGTAPVPARLGLSVGRKVGNAVARNRLKRVLREFFRLHQDLLEDQLDFVVVPKRSVDVRLIGLREVEKELLAALTRNAPPRGSG